MKEANLNNILKFPKKDLNGKVVYFITSSAKKVSDVPKMVQELTAEGAKVFLFPTEKSLKLMDLNEYSKIKNCQIFTDFNWTKIKREIPEEDLVIVAPCTFNTLNKIRYGIADSYPLTLISTAISKKKKVYIAPAFNEMWHHPQTEETIKTLTSWGCRIIWPEITKEKVSMVDWEKIIDSIYCDNCRVRFNSIKINDPDVEMKLIEARTKYWTVFDGIGKKQHREGSNFQTCGCYSVKVSKDWFLITSTGSDLSQLTEENLTLVKIDPSETIFWCGKTAPSSETPLHLAYYLKTKTEAVIHSHCPKLTYNLDLSQYCTPSYLRYGLNSNISVVPEQTLKQDGFIILKFHGEVSISANLEECYDKLFKYYNLYV